MGSKSSTGPQRNRYDKYAAYEVAVQSPKDDVRFFDRVYRQLSGRAPRTLTEDFCGTFSVCCHWVKGRPERTAVGIDLDPEPLAYGKKNHLSRLSPDERARVTILRRNVLSAGLPRTDLVCAMNFSSFVFKRRLHMLSYMRSVRARLRPGGIFIMDTFGGSQCLSANVERTKHGKLTYVWDQKNYDPISNCAEFEIHFEEKGVVVAKTAFTYSWRMWSIPELRDLMAEAGFERSRVFWEGTKRDGTGNGIFRERKVGEEDCDVWVAYVIGEAG